MSSEVITRNHVGNSLSYQRLQASFGELFGYVLRGTQTEHVGGSHSVLGGVLLNRGNQLRGDSKGENFSLHVCTLYIHKENKKAPKRQESARKSDRLALDRGQKTAKKGQKGQRLTAHCANLGVWCQPHKPNVYGALEQKVDSRQVDSTFSNLFLYTKPFFSYIQCIYSISILLLINIFYRIVTVYCQPSSCIPRPVGVCEVDTTFFPAVNLLSTVNLWESC